MIHVCDAIMGSGKTQSVITYINEHRNEKFIYITPYLDEADRIASGCPGLDMQKPKKLHRFHRSKVEHTRYLIQCGKNIATTHQAFKNYHKDMLGEIRDAGYTLIIDENVNILESCDVHMEDINIAMETGYIDYVDGEFVRTDKEYHGELYENLFHFLKTRSLSKVDIDIMAENAENASTLYFWMLPPEFITSFKDVFILTYIFDGTSLHHMLEINKLVYRYIGISKDPSVETGYRFSGEESYIPEYVHELKHMIDILDEDRFNAIGDEKTALSVSWFKRCCEDDMSQMKNMITNVFRNIWDDSTGDDRLWSTFNSFKSDLKGRGYTKSFAPFNMRASNRYGDRHFLIYACNIYMNVGEKLFYKQHDIEIDEDRYALSIMIQWIWRSAIRNGEKIHIYIPSSRMRNLLIDWINSFA